MSKKQANESVKVWHMPGLGKNRVQLMYASYTHRTFPKHTHDGFGVGVIETGALGFYYRGENVVAAPGQINLVNPDEVHTGQAADESGWAYRMFYFDAELFENIAAQMADKKSALPFFQSGIIQDQPLAQELYQLHSRLESEPLSMLEKQSRLLILFQQLISRHADASPKITNIGNEKVSIRRVMDFIYDNFHDDISIQQLAQMAHISPFHFIRVFSKQTGLAPHAFLMQLRVNKAKSLIDKGQSLSQVASQTGFSDQSHLTRIFKRYLGYTPGQYRNSVQDV